MTDADPPRTTDAEAEPVEIEVEVPVLHVPPPPDDLAYEDLEDYRQREVLRANGYPTDADDLRSVLPDIPDTLRSAALHTLGAEPTLTYPEALRSHLDSADDSVRVEAAYALARHGAEDGRATLVELLDLDPVGYLAPPLAAGYLARLGDVRGFPVVRRCLSEDLVGPRMLGCKQLFFFVPAHGSDDGQGGTIDVWAAFEQALDDPEESVAWQAEVQLRHLDDPEARSLLSREDGEGKGQG